MKLFRTYTYFIIVINICLLILQVVNFVEDTGLKVQTSRGEKEFEFDQVISCVIILLKELLSALLG